MILQIKSSRNQSYTTFFSKQWEKGNTKSLYETSMTLKPTPDMAIMRNENYRAMSLIKVMKILKN